MTQRPITVRFVPEVLARLEQRAQAERVSVSHLVERMISDQILKTKAESGGFDRTSAELLLMDFVRSITRQLMEDGTWDEHVTLHVFERIREEQRELYAMATAEGQNRRINQEIGSLVRQQLGAAVKVINGKRQIAQLGRQSDALIRTYTMLQPSEGEGAV